MTKIDVCPTWEAIIPLLVEAAANGTTSKARSEAMGELRRLARIVDQMNAQARAEESAHA